MEDKVKQAIELLRPQLQADGGDIEFVRIDDDNNVYVKLVGACGTCPFALQTLKDGVQVILKETIPEVNEVIRVG